MQQIIISSTIANIVHINPPAQWPIYRLYLIFNSFRSVILPLYFCRRMIKYSNQYYEVEPNSTTSTPFTNKTTYAHSKVPFKPTPLNFYKHPYNQNQQQLCSTPKTAKPYLDKSTKQGQNLSRSINVSSNKIGIKKDTSLITTKLPTQSKQNALRIEGIKTDKPNHYNSKTDRSQNTARQRVSNNQYANKLAEQIDKLRQTVSTVTSEQYKNAIAQKKPLNDEPVLRKKIQSQYQAKKDIKSKFTSNNYSRNTSRTELLQNVELTSKTDRPQQIYKTPPKLSKISQDKPLLSLTPKNKTMSQTDPTGSYFNLTQSKRVSRSSQLKIDDFQLSHCKGQGRFGKVFLAVHKKTGFLLAIKKVAKQAVRFMIDQFAQQIKINLFLNHPNIVRMYGCFSDHQHIYILMEYMEEGSLYKRVKLAKKFSEDETSTKLQQICQALSYLHSHDILHRDIKPENIVISHGVSKLCDFGWATYSRERRNTYCGTLDYVCPEILQGQSYDNFVDIWAIGVLAFEMLVGKAPFYHISRKQTMKSIMNCEFSFPSEISVVAKLFIMKALQKKADQRFTIDSLLKDRFLTQCARYE